MKLFIHKFFINFQLILRWHDSYLFCVSFLTFNSFLLEIPFLVTPAPAAQTINTSTHIALIYLEKDPVSTTDCNKNFFPFSMWLLSFYYSNKIMKKFFEGGNSILHHATLSLISLKNLHCIKGLDLTWAIFLNFIECYLRLDGQY